MSLKSVPSTKEIRYDRQLRLWGDDGQDRLERAHVCLLNASALGTEVLKSLVLPGVGAFTIYDGENVHGRDVGNNFFLSHDSIGKPRAQVACELLKELNPEVKGNFVVESPNHLLDNNISALDSFSVVIGTNLIERTARQISEYLWPRKIPFIHARCYGLIGYVRICVEEHTVVDLHPDNPTPDLRMDKPFPALAEIVKMTDLNAMTYQEHSHTPYLLILLKGLEKWRTKKGDPTALPSSYQERKEFKELLFSMRKPDDKGAVDEENFKEAADALVRTMHRTGVPSSVKQLIADAKCTNLTADSTDFWLLVSALAEYVDEADALPLAGVLPDMTSDSARYSKLSSAFHEQAAADAKRVYDLVQKRLTSLKLPASRISLKDAANFCKNAANLRLVRGTPLSDELAGTASAIQGELESYDATWSGPSMEAPVPVIAPAVWYVLLRAADRFATEKSRYPGTNGVPCHLDNHDLTLRVRALFDDWHAPHFVEKIRDEAVDEICRYGAGEPHPIAALLGGIVAQETIKLITHQYLPVDNTFVYD
uniref:NEDD8-activating enzyme E1 regulatory subunit n=1 Tax=Plectus sambesii TaxID=2011161 RepID=A0A914X7P2_9BILA